MNNRSIDSYYNSKVSVYAEAGVLVNDDIYFFSSEYNLLYKLHIPDFAISIVSHIPCSEILAFEWFRKVRYWNGKLLLIPSYAEKIWIYDLTSGEWDAVEIKYPQIHLKFWGAIIYQDNAFLFGVQYPAILKINLNNYAVSYLEIKYQINRNQEAGLFLTDAVRVEHVVFCPVSISNQVLQLNLKTFEYEWRQIGDETNRYSGIAYEKDCFWISSGESGKIVKWNGDSEWEEFEVPEEIANRSYQFIGVICDGNKKIFLTQQDGRSFKIVSKENEKVQTLLTEETKRYAHLESYENGTIVLMQSNAHIDVKWKGKWIKGICEIGYNDLKTYFRDALLRDYDVLKINMRLIENRFLGVNDYIEMITRQSEKSVKLSFSDGIGKDMWKTMR